MNSDLISREELKKATETCDKFACLPDTKLMPFYMLNEPEKRYEPYVRLRDIRKAIDNAPAVYDNPYSDGREDGYIEGYEEAKRECERPQGEWILVHPLQEDDEGAYMCSMCKTGYWCINSEFEFCPYCGAKMRKGGVV